MNSMNSEWDSTLVQNSDVADMSKFFSFDDFDQDQDISKDLDRLFAEPVDAIESENITPTGPQHLNHSESNAHTNASCSLTSKLYSQHNRDFSLQNTAEQLELSPLLARVNGATPPQNRPPNRGRHEGLVSQTNSNSHSAIRAR